MVEKTYQTTLAVHDFITSVQCRTQITGNLLRQNTLSFTHARTALIKGSSDLAVILPLLSVRTPDCQSFYPPASACLASRFVCVLCYWFHRFHVGPLPFSCAASSSRPKVLATYLAVLRVVHQKNQCHIPRWRKCHRTANPTDNQL